MSNFEDQLTLEYDLLLKAKLLFAPCNSVHREDCSYALRKQRKNEPLSQGLSDVVDSVRSQVEEVLLSAERSLSLIETTRQALHKETLRDYASATFMMYVREVWLGECDTYSECDTHRLVELAFDTDSSSMNEFRKILNSQAPSIDVQPDRVYTKLTNLRDACHYLFESDTTWEDSLTTEFMFKVHRMVMKDLLPSCGQFRKVNVGTGPFSHFPFYKNVPSLIQVLLQFLNSRLCHATGFRDRLLLAGFFTEKFLSVHPFENGNGRVARLLFSHLMRHVSVVPISLFLADATLPRDVYLSALKSARPMRHPPLSWMRYVIDCVSSHLGNIWFSLYMPASSAFEHKTDVHYRRPDEQIQSILPER